MYQNMFLGIDSCDNLFRSKMNNVDNDQVAPERSKWNWMYANFHCSIGFVRTINPLGAKCEFCTHAICGKCSSRSGWSSTQSDLRATLSVKESIDVTLYIQVSGQYSTRSACAYAPAQMELHCSHVTFYSAVKGLKGQVRVRY